MSTRGHFARILQDNDTYKLLQLRSFWHRFDQTTCVRQHCEQLYPRGQDRQCVRRDLRNAIKPDG
jgi:hypothetical protein